MTEQHGNGDGHSGDSASDPERPVKRLDSVVIRFAGDSGDGMQLTGTEFTRTAALFGNDIATFPDFPSEIRAPAGSLAGVSGFQLQFSSNEIFTAGDEPEVLVAMNPAALRTNLPDLQRGGLLIVNSGAFKAKNLELAGYASNPLEDGSLSAYRVVPIDFGKHVSAALQGAGLSIKEVSRTQNFFALGLLFWLYGREPAREIESIRSKFTKNPEFGVANVKAFELKTQDDYEKIGGWLRKASDEQARLEVGRARGSKPLYALWKRVNEASFLTEDEKREAVGYGVR